MSSIAASAWSGGGENSNYHGAGRFASSGVGMIAFGTVSGGVGAQLTGGNFWQGAVTGLVVSGLNHYMHKMQAENPNRTRARSIVDKYKHGDVNEIEQWLDDHPFVTKDGIVSFKGIDGLSVDTNPSNGNPDYMNNAYEKASQWGIKKMAVGVLKLLIKGGGSLLSDGGLAKVPQRNNGMITLDVSNAQSALIDYVFRPQGPTQNPAMINGFSSYSGLSRFDLYYKVK
ncbi:hypothetical protein [Flavobacterium phragmitis]|uniref:Uncharacterized protein n=1 Tax=Flavobacterium phragmitis TaxID=739143 RepID=A0A1I1SM12_9FLAO|nr:hypothetical protein [Flavobacterium phragmitis]SFD47441.1 hypothetical protein SAMN05216297_108114 [Flavobacterium phragmitis]